MADGAQPGAGQHKDPKVDWVLVPGNPPPAGAEVIWVEGEGGARVGHVFAATFQCVWHLALGPERGVALARWYRKVHRARGRRLRR